ncbi:MAG: transposase [Azoarcus sp.]|jgi:hypothetical protein|nr:transposase [Azoarcus sp.]
MIHVATSLKERTAPAHVIVERLTNSFPSDRLAKAFTNLGRIIKTEYILRYITDTPSFPRAPRSGSLRGQALVGIQRLFPSRFSNNFGIHVPPLRHYRESLNCPFHASCPAVKRAEYGNVSVNQLLE